MSDYKVIYASKARARSNRTMDPWFELKVKITENWNEGWGKCLEPRWQCKHAPIKAHSIQNARIIDQIAENGHVVTMKVTYHPTSPPFPDFGRVGRNKATTFQGFCAKHDHEIFRLIDVEPIDTDNLEQLFLLAYRAATRELHATMASACCAQASYKTAVDLGLSPGNRPCKLGLFAVERMAIAYDTFKYRALFDEDLLAGQYDRMRHRVFDVPCTRPTVAVSSLFSVDSVASGDGCLLLSLSILPLEDDRTVAIFSWRDVDDDSAVAWLDASGVKCGTSHDLRRELSRIALANCENIILTPSLVNSFSEEQKERVRIYYVATTFASEGEPPPLQVDLFV